MRAAVVCLVALSVYQGASGFQETVLDHSMSDDLALRHFDRIKRSIKFASDTWNFIFKCIRVKFETYDVRSKTRWYTKTGGYQEAIKDLKKMDVQQVVNKEDGKLEGVLELLGNMPVELNKHGNVVYLNMGRDVKGVRTIIKYSNN